MRPIDADALIKDQCRTCPWKKNGECIHPVTCSTKVYIESLPTLDLDDLRPKGERIKKAECSARNALGYEFNYCPNCGAKIGGGE